MASVVVAVMIFASVCTSSGSSASTPVCGVRGPSAEAQAGSQGPSAQIVGGEDAQPLEFPWQISLQVILRRGGDWEHFCGGAIINEQYIATAAHCVEVDPSPSTYRVKVGEYDLGQQDPYERRLELSDVTMHPKYDTDATTYDHALLKLKTPLNFSGADNAVMPICLPTKNQEFDGETCTASGWGFTKDDGKISPILKKVDLPIVPFEECNEDYEGQVDKNTMVCAGYEEGGKGTCYGDSGGPLVCLREDGPYVLAGSTSFGGGCAEPGYPPVFSRISTRLDWIKSIAGETP